jgi:L-iditol 2-dehydrogenase
VVIDPTKQNTKDAVMEATHGVGATIVMDASGRPDAMAATLELASFHGRVVIIGISVGGKAPAEMGLIQSKELQVRGIIGSPGVWPETIRFLSRTNLDLSKLVTSSFDISEADKAYQKVLTDKSQIKVHVTNSGK